MYEIVGLERRRVVKLNIKTRIWHCYGPGYRQTRWRIRMSQKMVGEVKVKADAEARLTASRDKPSEVLEVPGVCATMCNRWLIADTGPIKHRPRCKLLCRRESLNKKGGHLERGCLESVVSWHSDSASYSSIGMYAHFADLPKQAGHVQNTCPLSCVTFSSVIHDWLLFFMFASLAIVGHNLW